MWAMCDQGLAGEEKSEVVNIMFHFFMSDTVLSCAFEIFGLVYNNGNSREKDFFLLNSHRSLDFNFFDKLMLP